MTDGLRGTRVALTGGAGFVGSHILKMLLSQGYCVTALQNRQALPLHSNLQIVCGSLTDQNVVSRLVKDSEAVIHCGGLVSAQRDADFFVVNEQGTKNIVEAAETAGVQRFLLISSLAARGPAELSAYSASKQAGEIVLSEVQTNIGWDILRPPAVYGPGDLQILMLLRVLKAGIGMLIAGSDARASLIHVDDLATATLSWLESGQAYRQIFEIDDGTREGYSWREILACAADLLGVKPFYIVPPQFLMQSVAFMARVAGAKFLSPGKIRELRFADWVCRDNLFQDSTVWRPHIGLEMGLTETLAWYKQQGLI